MIGVGYIENNEFSYKVFHMNDLTNDEEYRVLSEFIDFINIKNDELNENKKYNIRLFHWSHAEQTMMENAFLKYPNLLEKMTDDHIEWVDMCDIFTSEPIVVKDALCFKLKEIGNALYSNGLINTYWTKSEIADGFAAMCYGIKFYQKENKTENDYKMFNTIIKYNKIDCKVVWEIVNLLRHL
jgi:hypothetical protein